jgi:hypothetical protein
MGKDNNKALDFKVPIPYIPEEEKEVYLSDGNPPPVKWLLDAKGDTICNPTIQVQPIFNGGTTEQLFKWYKDLSSLMEGQSVGEHYHLALQARQGTYKALWQRELGLAIMKLIIHVLKDPIAGFKQIH